MSSLCGSKNFYCCLTSFGNYLQNLLLLVFRLYWGASFFFAGLGKFQNVIHTTEFFSGLGVPFPELFVYLVAFFECIGGLFLFWGFLSRLVSIPLIVIMITALLTQHYDGAVVVFSDPAKFLAETPVTFLMVTLTVFCFGPGKISIDYLLETLFCKKKKTEE